MKIAILTQPLGHNYGGMMQAWALQQVLINAGHEVVTINRQKRSRGFIYTVLRFLYRYFMRVIGRRKLEINFEKNYPYIFSKTHQFINDNIVMSDLIDSTERLIEHFKIEQYDAVVVGSDQAWRPRYSPNIDNFFLDFLIDWDIKKIAYASSFGVNSWEFTEKQTKYFSKLITYFHAISVREDDGVDLCRKYLGVEVAHVLDPTLLLKKDDYEKLIGLDRIKKNKEGVYTYFLDSTLEKLDFASKVGVCSGEELFNCQAGAVIDSSVAMNIDAYVMPDPRDWLLGFANAKYVVTDSFHGMVFSIIFKKQFVVIGNKSRGMSRFTSLLNILGLSDFIVDDETYLFDSRKLFDIWDWHRIDMSLDKIRSESELFLIDGLN